VLRLLAARTIRPDTDPVDDSAAGDVARLLARRIVADNPDPGSDEQVVAEVARLMAARTAPDTARENPESAAPDPVADASIRRLLSRRA
jgi:hypothetical protein